MLLSELMAVALEGAWAEPRPQTRAVLMHWAPGTGPRELVSTHHAHKHWLIYRTKEFCQRHDQQEWKSQPELILLRVQCN